MALRPESRSPRSLRPLRVSARNRPCSLRCSTRREAHVSDAMDDKNGRSRRSFLIAGGAVIAATGVAVAAKLVRAPALLGLERKSGPRITGGWVNESAGVGHRLRDGSMMPAPRRTVRVPVVIVGGGIAGLSAAWHLDRSGFRDFVLLE